MANKTDFQTTKQAIENHDCFGEYGCKMYCHLCSEEVECYEQKNKRLMPTP